MVCTCLSAACNGSLCPIELLVGIFYLTFHEVGDAIWKKSCSSPLLNELDTCTLRI